MEYSDILLFLLVGAIVSLDVSALTFVKKETYLNKSSWGISWAAKNAFWHAFLLLIYSIISIAAIDIVLPFSLEGLIDLLPGIAHIFKEVLNHLPFIVGLVVIAIVWATYRNKICDNPLRGNTDIVPQFKLPAYLLNKIFSSEFAKEQAQAMMVAADMLALAFLLKSLDKLGDLNQIRHLITISALIFVSVFSICLLVHFLSRRSFNEILQDNTSSEDSKARLFQVLFLLRILEPFMIFYFLIELMSFIVWERFGSSSLFFIGSAFLVFALVKSVGLSDVIKTVHQMTDDFTKDNLPK